MDKTKERRKQERLCYRLPVWFAEDFNGAVSEGVMIDISSSAMAFSCDAGENCPHPGQRLTTRFSIPRSDMRDHSDMKTFTRTGRVCRVDDISDGLCRVAIQFDDPPPFWNMPPTVE